MERAAGAIAAHVRKPEGFRHQTLAGERRIAVDQHGEHAPALLVAELALLGAHAADDHRIDRLEMRRIGIEREMHVAPVELAVRRRAQVVLHVARALHVVRVGGAALELGQDRGIGLVHHMGEHAETAAVGHAEHHLLDAELAAPFQNLFQGRDQALAAVEAETLGADIFHVEEILEPLGLDQPFQDRALTAPGESGAVVDGLDTFLDPLVLVRRLDVHVLDADGAAIGGAHRVHDLAEGRVFEPEHVVDEDAPAEIGIRETVSAGIELGMEFGHLKPEGIEIGDQMPAHAIGVDHHQRVQRIPCGGTDLVGVAGCRGVVAVAAPLGGVAVRWRAVADDAAAPRCPARAVEGFPHRRRRVPEVAEEITPARVHPGGIVEIAGVELLDEGAVGTGEERIPFEIGRHR